MTDENSTVNNEKANNLKRRRTYNNEKFFTNKNTEKTNIKKGD